MFWSRNRIGTWETAFERPDHELSQNFHRSQHMVNIYVLENTQYTCMKCYGFAVFWNFRILKVVLGYKKWSKTAENEDSQRKIVELSNDMSDVFLAFLEMKCDTPYPTLFKWGEFMDSCEGSSLTLFWNLFWLFSSLQKKKMKFMFFEFF